MDHRINISIDEFLSSLKKSIDELKLENHALKQKLTQIPDLEQSIVDLKARIDLTKKTKQTLQTIESLESTVNQLKGLITKHEETISRLSCVEAENVAVKKQRAALVESQDVLHAKLQHASSEEARLRVIIDDDKKIQKLNEYDEWLYALAERLGVKRNNTIAGMRSAITDVIRKL